MSNLEQNSEVVLSAMEYFILALIDRAGLTSLYAFQRKAGLQPGGIRSALTRLEELHLIRRAESAARRLREMSLTEEGVGFLEATFLNCLRNYPDTESVLRAAFVVLLMGRVDKSAGYLQGVALLRKAAAKEKHMKAEVFRQPKMDPLSTYAWMRAQCEAQRRNSEYEAFSALSQLLKERPVQDDPKPK